MAEDLEYQIKLEELMSEESDAPETAICDHCVTYDADGTPHMAGIPTWMAVTGVIVIILVSHLFLSKKQDPEKESKYWKFDLLSLFGLRKLVKKRYFPFMLQSFSVLAMLLVIGAGLWGSQKVGYNIGPIITWTWWWALLIFLVFGFGTAFCAICPWEGMASMISSLSFRSRKKRLTLGARPWPKWLSNVYPALILFLFLTWIELGLDITKSPRTTAVLAIIFTSMVVMSALVYDRRGFCRYACLIGRITGIYSLYAPVEVRSISADACSTCTTKDCYKGNEEATGCPTFLFPSTLKENTYCTMCTECVRSCPHDNMTINIRTPGVGLFNKFKFRMDEAVLSVTLLALTSFHGLTMTPAWDVTSKWVRAEFGLGHTSLFSVLMLIALVVPIGVFVLSAYGARRMTASAGVSTKQIFMAYAYAVLPVALFYHLAHNSMHFFMEAQYIITVMSDPFGYGWNLFGTAGNTYDPLLPMQVVWWIQLIFIVVGHIYGVVVADRIAKRLFTDRKQALLSLLPMLIVMIAYSAYSVWLIAQPMIMRTGM